MENYETIARRMGYVHKGIILRNSAIKKGDGYIKFRLSNHQKLLGYVREGGNCFKENALYETYILIQSNSKPIATRSTEQGPYFTHRIMTQNKVRYQGILECIFDGYPYQDNRIFVKMGLNCGLKIRLDSDFPNDISLKPNETWFHGSGNIWLDFLSIEPLDE